jgi:hypothetical protein
MFSTRRLFVIALITHFGLSAAYSQNPQPPTTPPKFDPAKFVQIYEDVGDRRILIYDPVTRSSRKLKADVGSVLVIKVNLAATPDNTLISNLYMSAELGGEKPVSVPVVGYSELGLAKETAGSQTAVSSQTVDDIRENVSTMYWTTREIIDSVYGVACVQAIAAAPTTGINDAACVRPAADINTRAVDALRLHKAEIETIAGALTDPKNIEITRVIGNTIFGLSAATLAAAADDFRKDFESLAVGQPLAGAVPRLLERIKLILRDLCMDVNGCDDPATVEEHLTDKQQAVLMKLRELVVDGQIFLAETKARDGDTLKLRIESVSKGAGGGTAAAEFEVNLRQFGVKPFLSPSIFFITRASVNERDLDRVVQTFDSSGATLVQRNPIKAMRGAPFPGMTFGVTAFHRGLTTNNNELVIRSNWRDKLQSALAPGIGVNVSFMSFDDPRDFDPSNSQFSQTSAGNFQLGAGAVASLFNNAVQFTYGVNLNESQKRRYFGFGFGFVEIGRVLSGYLKKP